MTLFCPNFFIPGAAKSGTTTLHELFNAHPDICMSSIKEPVYWNSDNFTSHEKIKWYKDLFDNPEAKIIGESTTSYMYYESFISSIKTHFKNSPKFVFILRNPIDRCYSHYWWMVGRGQESRTFKKSLEFDLNRSFTKYGYVPDYYFHFGLYGKWIENFYTNFARENIKIITLEQLTHDRKETLNSCFRFLGLSEMSNIPELKKNKTLKLKYPKLFHFTNKMASGKYQFTKFAKYLISRDQINSIKTRLKQSKFLTSGKKLNYEPMSMEDRQWVKSLYEKDINKLKFLTGRTYNEWSDFI